MIRQVLVTVVSTYTLFAGYLQLVDSPSTVTIEQVAKTKPKKHHHKPGFVHKNEPYGGCDEAYLYPNTPGGRWCRRHGLS